MSDSCSGMISLQGTSFASRGNSFFMLNVTLSSLKRWSHMARSSFAIAMHSLISTGRSGDDGLGRVYGRYRDCAHGWDGAHAYLELVEDLSSSALPDGLCRFDHSQEEPDGLVGELSEDHQDQLRQDVVDFDIGVPDARNDLGEGGVPLQDHTSEHEARDVFSVPQLAL